MSPRDAARIRVRRLLEHDWRLFRALRLAALADAPDAFSSTRERELAFDDATWQGRLAESEAKVSLAAELAGKAVGIAHGQLDAARPTRAWLMAMWVSPDGRRLGVGGALVDAVTDWARSRGAEEMVLQVTEGNRAAESLYATRGFRPSGESEPLRPGSRLSVRTFARSLS